MASDDMGISTVTRRGVAAFDVSDVEPARPFAQLVVLSERDLGRAARALEVAYAADLAVQRHVSLARAPRSARAWGAIQNRLWLVREDALRAGLAAAHSALTACWVDADRRRADAVRAGGAA